MSAKLFKDAGGTKPVFAGGMKFRGMKCLSRVKTKARRSERHGDKLRLVEPEQGDPRAVGREFGMVQFKAATASRIGVTGYTANLTSNDGRLYLE